MTLEEAIKELYFWQYSSDPSWFTAKLFDLIAKADPLNRFKLAEVFPAEVKAWMMWQESPNEEEFFRSHGIGK